VTDAGFDLGEIGRINGGIEIMAGIILIHLFAFAGRNRRARLDIIGGDEYFAPRRYLLARILHGRIDT
jgi:hypothetical protein